MFRVEFLTMIRMYKQCLTSYRCCLTMVLVLVCGGGNGAHVLAGISSSQPGVQTRVLTLFADEAERWTDQMKDSEFSIKIHEHGVVTDVIRSKPSMVTKDTAKAAEGVDVIIFAVPAFAHTGYLEALRPYLRPGLILVGLPGQSGFDFNVKGVWGEAASQVTIMSFESLPWACRILEFGRVAEVLGIKDAINGAIKYGEPAPDGDPTATLQSIMGKVPRLKTFGHLLGMTFMATNSYIHPSLMYAYWHKWDGTPLKEKPLFYHGVSHEGAGMLSKVSNEILTIAREITRQRPQADLSNVSHVHEWYKRCYPENIEDDSSLYSCLRTNNAYNGLGHPLSENADGTFHPNYSFRYLTEDIPFGLAVIKGVGSIVGVETPCIDKVITWAQGCMNKEYLVDGSLTGRDVPHTRSPQAYGITTLDGVLGL